MRLKKGQLFESRDGELVVISDVSDDIIWTRRRGVGHAKPEKRDTVERQLKGYKLRRDL